MKSQCFRLIAVILVMVFAGCAPPGNVARFFPGVERLDSMPRSPLLQTPALLAINPHKGAIQYWPIALKGASHPATLYRNLELQHANGMAADGRIAATAIYDPASIFLYDTSTGRSSMLADPYGAPINVAIDKNENIFALHYTVNKAINITMFRGGLPPAKELTCNLARYGASLSSDDEGDLIVGGYGTYTTKVIEFENGPNGLQSGKCSLLSLRLQPVDDIETVQVDPKTDDLVVLDNPDLCAGGREGRITIYPKPYRYGNAHSIVLGGVCPSDLHLSADSKYAFVIDVIKGAQRVRQITFPDGKKLGFYSGGFPTSITTVPSALPN